ncbi:MAG: amino acid ABC transporter permease [bacterium]
MNSESFFAFFQSMLPPLGKGAVMTIEITAISVGMGVLIGIFGGIARVSKNLLLLIPSTIYVEVIRGTPLLAQLFIVYFGLPSLGINLPPFTAAVIAMGVNSGAYVTEIFRGGIQSIERGQMEASRSLGLSYFQTMRYVILPQALKRVLPPLGNEFIAMLKDSSLASTIAIAELMRVGREITSRTFRSFEVLGVVALLYLAITLPLSLLVRYMERRMSTSD